MELKIKLLHERATLPAYQTDGSVGLDISTIEDVRIWRQARTVVRTGLAVEIPSGYEGQVRLRSSMGLKGLLIPHGVGTIDSDYRGELLVAIWSLYDNFTLLGGTRFAQLIVLPVMRMEVVSVEDLSPTARGVGGFGSTGNG